MISMGNLSAHERKEIVVNVLEMLNPKKDSGLSFS